MVLSQTRSSKKILARSFYLRPTVTVAKDLLGQILCFDGPQGFLSGRIVEVEAYLGAEDLASHAAKGPTPRCEVMFGRGGHAYVYFSYGAHFCMNAVTEARGTGHAVLIRALEPLDGIEIMKKNRRKEKIEDLCSGPGKLCQALGITRTQNGWDLCASTLSIRAGTAPKKISASPRIGIQKNADALLRFFDAESTSLSKRLRTLKP